ncbi:max-binding protein MNT isoform X2 [Lampris incognitus]|uniref:max-binding protein MNT isoform X2 n=1 Tax=Lampris incognitus TaxID=2546036 RepID=UPI0024B59590|nr:max-binding protein MNT isoform X2 [Lampris incognitus]
MWKSFYEGYLITHFILKHREARPHQNTTRPRVCSVVIPFNSASLSSGKEMSIETLLEAAKFLELQAQQQQKAREENDLREKLRLEQSVEQRRFDVNYNTPVHINNVAKAEQPLTERRPSPLPPPMPPPSMPITVIPIPVVTSNHTGLPPAPATTLSSPAAPHLASPRRDPHSPQEQSAATLPLSLHPKPDHPSPVPDANHKQQQQNHHHHPQLITPPGNTKLLQQPPQQLIQGYPSAVVSGPQQHALLPQPAPLPPQASLQNSPTSRGSPPDDGRHLDNKRRPGGRAHLKECFETLKKNIPNVDEKKTSNLSVLRSALRYIQTLKRKEKEYEHEMERLAREKIATQQRLAELKNDLSQWMDVLEIDRVLRQTVQPEEDQASTSTASEGEDIMDDDLDDETVPKTPTALPAVPQAMQPELRKTVAPTVTLAPTTTSLIAQHVSIQHKTPLHQPQLQPQPTTSPQALPKPPAQSTLAVVTSGTPTTTIQALLPTHAQMVTTPSLQPTVIAHASASHASVIQAVNHVIQAGGPKHIAHLAPSTTTNSVQLAPGHQPISHITVHPVTHLGQHLPALYHQPVAVTQPAMVGHISHTLTHTQVNGTTSSQPAAAIVDKQTAIGAQVVTHHPQLVGQTVLNPVTMVTMPSFPVSTLKLA